MADQQGDALRIYSKQDVDPSLLTGKTIAIIGYGSQGRAHALNLRDTGLSVIVGAREEGPSKAKARADGFVTVSPKQAAKDADLIVMSAPDMAHQAIFESDVRVGLEPGNALLFLHGFSVFYGLVKPPEDIDVIMVAPKGPGNLVRREYEHGRGVACLFSVHQDASGKAAAKALAYADAIGGTKAAIFETSFGEETETDMFGEQAVLCGGATALVVMGYETLVEAGYRPEMAYYECLHELKLVVDLLHEGGLAKMHEFISETAAYGDLVSGPRVINEETRARMREILTEIKDGTFARHWIAENQQGKKNFTTLRNQDLAHEIEEVGARVRSRMPWLK